MVGSHFSVGGRWICIRRSQCSRRPSKCCRHGRSGEFRPRYIVGPDMRGWVRFLQSHGLIDLYCANAAHGPDWHKKTSNSVAATLRHKMMICDFRFAVLAVFLTRTISSTAVAGSTIRMRRRDVTAARQLVLPDYPLGIGATNS